MIPNVNSSASVFVLASTLPPTEGVPASALPAALSAAAPAEASLASPLAPEPNQSAAPAENPNDPKEAKKLTERVNELLAKETNVALRFDLTEANQVRSFQLVDRDTNEVIMQYPSKEALHLRDRLEAAAKLQTASPSSAGSGSAVVSGMFLSTRA